MIKVKHINQQGHTLSEQSAERGFTLIELSIVLVIIGLIVGGVLVGQDLIKAAQIRATVSQIEKFNAAANTFRSKYNGLPGDLPSPANFFSVTGTWDGSAGKADGNRQLQPITAGGINGEPIAFWGELSLANLIAEPIITGDAMNVGYDDDPNKASHQLLPTAKMGKGNDFAVLAQNGINYFIVGKPTTAHVSVVNVGLGLSPTEAYQIDTKLDDGAPGTGTVLSILDGTAPAPATFAQSSAESAAGCANSGTAATAAYDIGAHGNATDCVLGIRSSF